MSKEKEQIFDFDDTQLNGIKSPEDRIVVDQVSRLMRVIKYGIASVESWNIYEEEEGYYVIVVEFEKCIPIHLKDLQSIKKTNEIRVIDVWTEVLEKDARKSHLNQKPKTQLCCKVSKATNIREYSVSIIRVIQEEISVPMTTAHRNKKRKLEEDDGEKDDDNDNE
jgi:hypothetical protein